MEASLFSARLVRHAPRFDRLYLYRVPLSEWAAGRLRRRRSRILFDLDDAWDAPEGDETAVARLRRRFLERSLRRAVSVSSLVVVSNERNAEAVRGLGGRAEVVPTAIDLEKVVYRDRAQGPIGPRPVVGWMGTPSTARYLAMIEPALARVASERRVCIRVVGSGRTPFAALEAESQGWSAEREAQDIAAFDIGLMPMPDTPWTRGKAALKALQYGASGAPTVASWTSTNDAILGSDRGTLFCRSEEDWVRAIVRLVDEPARRGEIGRRGRQLVEGRYSVELHAPRLAGLIRHEAVSASSGLDGELK